MTTPELAPLVQHIHAAVAPQARERSDEELLKAFAASRDESAFTAIVRRHGGLVLAVCRRALRHEQDAEDAFQATFLVLARDAARIRNGRSLASWLHGVSYRIAVKARQVTARRRAQPVVPDRVHAGPPADELGWREVQAALDEEIGRLPELYREPFVLCCLEGRSRAEAAALLRLKDGTLSSRLAEARKRVQQALARRGVALSALLAPVPAVPTGLARAAVRVALLSELTQAVPTSVHDLAQGVTSTMTRTTTRLVVALLLTAAVLAGAAGLLPRPPRVEAQLPAPPTAAAAKKTPESDDGTTALVRGQVLRPDGKPAAGASLFFRWAGALEHRASKVRATADSDGRFSFRVPSGQLQRGAKIVATARGFAPAWEELTAKKAEKGVHLTLCSDDVALSGRLISLEGTPLEGIKVEVMWVGQHRASRVAHWIDRFVSMHRKGYWINEDDLSILRPQALGLPASVVTGKDGRFRLAGLGRDRVLTLVLRGERTVAARLQVPLCDGPKEGWVKGDHGLYPTGFTFMLAPTKPIVGTVRDRKTGKPIAGVLVAHSNYHARTTTNEKGEYRIIGAPKESRYMISLGGGKGVPYIDYTRHDIPDTQGLEPLQVDFELERGVEISGRILDRVTGKPVRGRVDYFLRQDNPNTKDFTTLGGGKFIISKWGEIGPDGSFTVLGIPGPGVLVARAHDSTAYVRIDARALLQQRKVISFPIGATHGFIDVDASENDPKSRTVTINLTPAGRRAGRILGPDGKLVAGAQATGLTDSLTPTRLATDKLTMPGLRKGQNRALVVLHPQRKLGAVATVSGDSDQPFEVKLGPLGTLTGRLVDVDGKALPDRKVLLFLWLDKQKFENLPTEWCPFDTLIATGWRDFTTREGTTDKEGRFRIEGLIPGQRYDLNAGQGQMDRVRNPPTHRYRDFEVEPGKLKDTGDLKPQARSR
jgi:RNA polymerase sigma factor (sigma-70 family)